MSLTPERKLKKVAIDLMRNPLFADWSGVMMLGTKSISDDVPTAMTNGRDEVYGTAFVQSLDFKELAFVMLHECAHKMLRQLTVWRKLFEEDQRLTNQAADYVVNLMLTERDPGGTVIKMPMREGKAIGLLDKRFTNMTTKQVFDILKKEQEEGGGGSGGGGFDEHDWEGADELTKEEREQFAKELDQAIRQGQMAAQKMHGKTGSTGNRELQGLLEPKVDWRELLRDFVNATCAARDFSSWRKPNRRFLGSDMYLPSLIGERVKSVVIGCDTSGSISDAEHARNISETNEILKSVNPEEVHVIYWDHTVAGHEVYDAGNMDSFATTTRPEGGGGTDPTAMMRYLKEKNIKPDCIIQFTDGCIGDWGNEWEAPMLWCLVGSWAQGKLAPVGKTVHIQD